MPHSLRGSDGVLPLSIGIDEFTSICEAGRFAKTIQRFATHDAIARSKAYVYAGKRHAISAKTLSH
jgi:hypothetical protein